MIGANLSVWAAAIRLAGGMPAWVPNPANPPDIAINWQLNQAWLRTTGLTSPALLGIATSRASVKQVVDSQGNWSQVASNVTAMSDLGRSTEEARTNSIRNNTMQGAVAGSPGALPTNWANDPIPTGITQTIIGTGTQNGIDYIDISFSGTPGSSANARFFTEGSTNVIGALYGQTWTQSAFLALIAGATTNTAFHFITQELTSGGANALQNIDTVDYSATITAVPQRFAYNTTLSAATTAFVRCGLIVAFTSGQAVNFTLRIGWPQLENNSINSTVASAVRAASGTGGVNGTGVYSVAGTGTPATLNCTWAAGVLTVNSVASAGSYTTFPAAGAALTYVSGTATGWAGATVNATPTNQAADAFATSPIKTSSVALTRLADVTTLSGLSYGSAFSMFEKFTAQSPVLYSNNQYILEISDGEDVNQRLLMFRALGSAPLAPRYSVGGSNVYTGASVGTILQNVSSKAAIAAISGTQNSALNGTALTSGTGVGTITPNVVNFGCDPTGGHQLNGLAAIDAIWLSQAVPSAQLQAMTT